MTALEKLRSEIESFCGEVLLSSLGGVVLDKVFARRQAALVDQALKAVEDEQRWIPFEELDIGEAMYRDVLVITEDGSIQIATYVDPGGFLGLNELFSDIVTHWRPLPEGPGEQ